MPVPKKYQKKYGIIVATLQKKGFSHEEAKRKTDEAIKELQKKEKKK